MFKGIPEENQGVFAQKVSNVRAETNKKHNKQYSYLKTKDEYWEVVNEYWVELLDIILSYAPPILTDMEGEFKEYFGKRTIIVLEELKRDKNTDLIAFFNKTWASAPNSGSIHAIPGWNVLCDLCSECELAFEDNYEINNH